MSGLSISNPGWQILGLNTKTCLLGKYREEVDQRPNIKLEKDFFKSVSSICRNLCAVLIVISYTIKERQFAMKKTGLGLFSKVGMIPRSPFVIWRSQTFQQLAGGDSRRSQIRSATLGHLAPQHPPVREVQCLCLEFAWIFSLVKDLLREMQSLHSTASQDSLNPAWGSFPSQKSQGLVFSMGWLCASWGMWPIGDTWLSFFGGAEGT